MKQPGMSDPKSHSAGQPLRRSSSKGPLHNTASRPSDPIAEDRNATKDGEKKFGESDDTADAFDEDENNTDSSCVLSPSELSIWVTILAICFEFLTRFDLCRSNCSVRVKNYFHNQIFLITAQLPPENRTQRSKANLREPSNCSCPGMYGFLSCMRAMKYMKYYNER